MTAVLIVHGIGDQTRGEVAETLAQTLAKTVLSQRNPPTSLEISALKDVQWPAQIPTPECSVVTAGHCDVSGPPKLSVYAYHWADKRGIDGSFVVQWFVFWRLFLGLPRLGLAALDASPHTCGRCLVAMARWLYFTAWTIIVARVLSTIVVYALLIAGVKLSLVRTQEIQLAFDLLLWAVFLLFSANILLLTLAKPDGLRLYPAVMALAATQFLTHALELAIATIARAPAAGGTPIFQRDTTANSIITPITAAWFYAPNSFPGFWPSVNFAMVLAGMVGFGSWYAIIHARSNSQSCLQSASQVDKWITRLRKCSYLFVWSILFVLPFFGSLDMAFTLMGITPFAVFAPNVTPATDIVGAIGNAAPTGQGGFAIVVSARAAANGIAESTNLRANIIDLLTHFPRWVSVPFVVVIVGVLSSSRTRAQVVPFAALVLDVLNYLPPIKVLDRFAAVRFLFGGTRSTTEPSLKDELCCELSNLVLAIAATHGGRVLVVAHSLGSMIALTAIDAIGVHNVDKKFVQFVTMGSPIPLLAQMFPTVFGAHAQKLHMSIVAAWHNLYKSGDLVGRQIGTLPHLEPPAKDDCIGAGGHTGYFTDRQLAERVLELLAAADASDKSAGAGSAGADLPLHCC